MTSSVSAYCLPLTQQTLWGLKLPSLYINRTPTQFSYAIHMAFPMSFVYRCISCFEIHKLTRVVKGQYVTRRTRKSFETQQKCPQRNEYLGSLPCKILWTILNMDKGETLANRLEDKEIDDYAQGLTGERCTKAYTRVMHKGLHTRDAQGLTYERYTKAYIQEMHKGLHTGDAQGLTHESSTRAYIREMLKCLYGRDAQGLTYERWHRQVLRVKKRQKEEDSKISRIA